jgi:prepilin-type processing-associated H-X9-DG protein
VRRAGSGLDGPYAGRVSPVPSRFDYDEPARALLIEWDDNAVHRIPFEVLRRACPCAACHGEMGSAGRFAVRPALEPGEDDLADISLVGSYGLNVVWADGHNTGIYTFERLRELGERVGAQA